MPNLTSTLQRLTLNVLSKFMFKLRSSSLAIMFGFCTLALLIPNQQVVAQVDSVIYKDYAWEKDPKLSVLDSNLKDESEVVLKYKSCLEYVYNDELGRLEQYSLMHKIIKVNSDDAVEANNRVYLPLRNINNVVFQKARVITSKGEVIEVNKSDIKEAEDEENKRKYKYFALRGVDVGSEIETMYLVERVPSYTGNSLYFQSEIPYKNVESEIICPSHLRFDIKSYNGFPELEQDTMIKDRRVMRAKMDYIEKLEKEDFAVFEPNLKHIVYKLGDNIATGKNVVNYGKISSVLYSSVYRDFDNSTLKAIKKLMKTIGASTKLGDEENIQLIENYMKTKIQVVDVSHPKLVDPREIIANSIGNEQGITAIYGTILNLLEIENHLVLTTNRYEKRFDPEYEAYHFLEEYMIYFPELKKYIAPAAILNRLNCPPYQYSSNYGLFIKPVTIGEFTSGIGKVKFIEPISADASLDKMEITVRIKDDLENIEEDIHKETHGYYAQSIQPIYEYLDDDGKKEITDAAAKFNDPDAEIISCEFKNMESQSFGVKPMICDAKLTSNLFLERAGSKLLFKVGLLIGQQSEMYEDKERKLPIENSFNRYYKRILTINVPDGYTVSNAKDLNFDINDKNDKGEISMAFTSKYTLEGSTLVVEIDEYYRKIHYELDQVNAYRKVINGAADFNKVVLVLKKN